MAQMNVDVLADAVKEGIEVLSCRAKDAVDTFIPKAEKMIGEAGRRTNRLSRNLLGVELFQEKRRGRTLAVTLGALGAGILVVYFLARREE